MNFFLFQSLSFGNVRGPKVFKQVESVAQTFTASLTHPKLNKYIQKWTWSRQCSSTIQKLQSEKITFVGGGEGGVVGTCCRRWLDLFYIVEYRESIQWKYWRVEPVAPLGWAAGSEQVRGKFRNFWTCPKFVRHAAPCYKYSSNIESLLVLFEKWPVAFITKTFFAWGMIRQPSPREEKNKKCILAWVWFVDYQGGLCQRHARSELFDHVEYQESTKWKCWWFEPLAPQRWGAGSAQAVRFFPRFSELVQSLCGPRPATNIPRISNLSWCPLRNVQWLL